MPEAADQRSVAAGDHQIVTPVRKFLNDSNRMMRAGIGCLLGFCVGFGVQTFACRTRLYDSVTDAKMRRRLEMDEMVLELRGDIRKWQAEDMARAARKSAAAA